MAKLSICQFLASFLIIKSMWILFWSIMGQAGNKSKFGNKDLGWLDRRESTSPDVHQNL